MKSKLLRILETIFRIEFILEKMTCTIGCRAVLNKGYEERENRFCHSHYWR